MATIKLSVNNVLKTLKAESLEVYAGLLTVGDVGAKGLQTAVKTAGGESFAVSLLDSGAPDDVIEVTKEITRKGVKGIVTGRTSRQKLAARIRTALIADTFDVEIITVMDGATAENSDGESADFVMEAV